MVCGALGEYLPQFPCAMRGVELPTVFMLQPHRPVYVCEGGSEINLPIRGTRRVSICAVMLVPRFQLREHPAAFLRSPVPRVIFLPPSPQPFQRPSSCLRSASRLLPSASAFSLCLLSSSSVGFFPRTAFLHHVDVRNSSYPRRIRQNPNPT